MPNLQYTKQQFVIWNRKSGFRWEAAYYGNHSWKDKYPETKSYSYAEFMCWCWNRFVNQGCFPDCEHLSIDDVERLLLLM